MQGGGNGPTRNLLESFKCAIEGIVHALATERNLRIHFSAALAVMVLSLLFGVNRFEALLLFIAITLVIVAELFNTALEAVVDLVTTKYHPLAKVAKDVAAGAVFLTAGLALAIGLIVFIPYILDFLQHALPRVYDRDVSVSLVLGMVLFATMLLKARANVKGLGINPSLQSALAVSIVLTVWWLTFHVIVAVLVTVLSILLIGGRLLKPQDIPSVLWGAAVGGVFTVIGIMLNLV
ncbi:diacylglycerol kinase [Numidum massiliense]|uniref:diacylglycerol kinase n=1 Tax=Numidum massiliense TaxID=1522315 RepID=UPI0006D5AD12|nr:diacylglycerol kinase [Numidum massiliense]